MTISKEEFKKEIKRAVKEVIEELIRSGEFYEIMEDIALKRAIDEGRKTEDVSYMEILKALNSEG